MNDRIKLAEAMGWRWEEGDGLPIKSVDGGWQMPGHPAGAWFDLKCPDPFTDANDDYAVSIWMRSHIFSKRNQFIKALAVVLQDIVDSKDKCAWPDAAFYYKVGDYARAALKVIGETK